VAWVFPCCKTPQGTRAAHSTGFSGGQRDNGHGELPRGTSTVSPGKHRLFPLGSSWETPALIFCIITASTAELYSRYPGTEKKELEDVPLSHPEVTKFIRENINEGLKEWRAGYGL